VALARTEIGMTLDQLEIFLAVAQHLHFTRAADLYITQPSVSAAIQSLENSMGSNYSIASVAGLS
jgi:DNA-binding transcriptional LysR family regulator